MGQQYKYYLSKQYDYDEYIESGEKDYDYLVIRVHKSGKDQDQVILAPYCDFVEESRTRIKAPKGYLVRRKKRLSKKRSSKKTIQIW